MNSRSCVCVCMSVDDCVRLHVHMYMYYTLSVYINVTCTAWLQNSEDGELINPEFVVFNDNGPRFELLMKVSYVHIHHNMYVLKNLDTLHVNILRVYCYHAYRQNLFLYYVHMYKYERILHVYLMYK